MIYLLIPFSLIALALLGLFFKLNKLSKPQSTVINTDTRPFINELDKLKKELGEVPTDVLLALTGSVNTHKGKLGELIGYVQLKAEYDRIIPLSNIADFICIKLPTEDQAGCIDFVDIKTGGNARLSKDQRALKQLIQKKLVNFKTIKIDMIDGVEGSEDDSGTNTD